MKKFKKIIICIASLFLICMPIHTSCAVATVARTYDNKITMARIYAGVALVTVAGVVLYYYRYMQQQLVSLQIYDNTSSASSQINQDALEKLIGQFSGLQLSLRNHDDGGYGWILGRIGAGKLKAAAPVGEAQFTRVVSKDLYTIFSNTVFFYKIHLTPPKEYVGNALQQILGELQKNELFAQSVFGIKVIDQFGEKDDKGNRHPTIVIYAQVGKESAQQVLDTVYHLLLNNPNDSEPLKYNRAVFNHNDPSKVVCWYAQGDSGCKLQLRDYFEWGNDQGAGRVHLKPNVLYNEQLVSFEAREKLKKKHEALRVDPSYKRYALRDLPFPEYNADPNQYHLKHPGTGMVF